jgi:hypothetical protein
MVNLALALALLCAVCSARLDAGTAIERLEAVSSYSDCVGAVTSGYNNNQPIVTWCILVQRFAQHWGVCEDAFGFLDKYGACAISITACPKFTTDEQLLPVAAECLSSCSLESGCIVPMIGKLINDTGICPQGVPPAILNTMLDLPFGPVLPPALAAFSYLTTSAYNFADDAPFIDRYPLPEYIGAWVQAYICIGASLTVIRESSGQGSTCGFLIFNTLGLSSTVAGTVISIAIICRESARGMDKHGASWASKFGNNVMKFPAYVATVAIFFMICGAIPLFVTALPALIAFVHVTVIQSTFVAMVTYAFYRVGSMVVVQEKEAWEERNQLAGKKSGETYSNRGDYDTSELPVFAFLMLPSIQAVQALGCSAWSWYLGVHYTTVHSSFFYAFTLPQLNWNIDFNFHGLFAKDLNEFQLFGYFAAVQVLITVASLIRRVISLCRADDDDARQPSSDSDYRSLN